MTEQPKTDENKFDWSRRDFDPMIRMRWNSSIVVNPANTDKGIHHGQRIYPDGTIENFYVE